VTLLSSSKYDILWIEKEIFPWLPAWFEMLFPAIGVPYVVDYDDAVYHRYDMHSSWIVRALLRDKIDKVMRHAALVIVGNDYLAARAKHAGAKRIEYLPSVVDVSQYIVSEDSTQPPFRIGWVGSPVTAPYLDEVREALKLVSHEANIHVTLVGSGNIPPFSNAPTTILTWGEAVERSIGGMFHVGIMPLVDGPFERGKCGYKLVQYMAAGLPVIASPVGVNMHMIEPGINGYLVSSTEEWIQALRSLIQNRQLCSAMGKAGRQKVEQKYNLQRTAPKLLEFLKSVKKSKDLNQK
jgi:glycosyltransferase involved in cell wall biosynthesis